MFYLYDRLKFKIETIKYNYGLTTYYSYKATLTMLVF